MKTSKLLVKFIIVCTTICSGVSFAQPSQDWTLDKMPVDLEMDFALSALPPQLRDQSTVYLLDPKKGYYIARQGTNGFSTFVSRTEWESGVFDQDTFGAISYDAEGTKTHLPVFLDVAEMRASGKYSASQIRDIVVKRVKDGTYKAPSRTGISYMLSPLLRTRQDRGVVNMVMPHYMFYAPRVEDADIGGGWKEGVHQPFVVNSGKVLDINHSIFNYIILTEGEAERSKIIEEQKDLLRRLAEYKSCLKVEISTAMHH